jgi:hypothetical protein
LGQYSWYQRGPPIAAICSIGVDDWVDNTMVIPAAAQALATADSAFG